VCRLLSLPVVLSLVFLSIACAEPPSKEMNQAQGAIAAAEAAGAAQYAPTELSAATDALKRSEEAVTQRDYRLALSLAIDSRERAQNAVKVATDARARASGDAERVIAEITTLLIQATDRLRDPNVAHLPRKVTEPAQAAVSAADKRMQEARAALKADDYARVASLTDGLAAQLRAILAETRPALAPSPARKRR
jgi:hypothetical protein